jgi:hypothetical protein
MSFSNAADGESLISPNLRCAAFSTMAKIATSKLGPGPAANPKFFNFLHFLPELRASRASFGISQSRPACICMTGAPAIMTAQEIGI